MTGSRRPIPAAPLDKPLNTAEFADLMMRLGPFEAAPRLAVAVSGGADSMALAVLLHDWARAAGGSVTALTVDHGLRPEAPAEARYVGRTLRPLGIGHKVLRWAGPKPTANIQAVARRARYELLTGWCEAQGVLHLALAHHLDDQAETLLLRLGRGSGLDGLAAMAPVVELPRARLIRPLLGVPKARLEATLTARRISWIEDPSNQDAAHARVRIRQLMPALAVEGLTSARLAAAAGHLRRAKGAIDYAVAGLLAQAATVHPAGHAMLDAAALMEAPEEVGLRALARTLMTVGGAEYTPRLERLERLYGRIHAGLDRGVTLGGCRVIPRDEGLLLVREPAKIAECRVRPGEHLLWDGRFEVVLHKRARARRGALTLAGLGRAGWAEVVQQAPEVRGSPIPGPARPALPALSDALGLLVVPHLGFERPGKEGLILKHCRFSPKTRLVGAPFTVA